MSELRLGFCTHEAATFAVTRWHYSRKMPKAKLVKIGCWEDDRFVGAVILGSGANRHLANPFGLKSTEVVELVRVALAPGREHPTSKCLSIALKLLRRQSPGLRVVLSYADTGQRHTGLLYRASGWLYLGGSEQSYIKVLGKVEHPRTLYDRFGRHGQSISWLQTHVDPRAERVPMATKRKFAFPLDKSLRRTLEKLALPYPAAAEVTPGDTPGSPPGEGGSSPTRPLHDSAAEQVA